MNLLKELNLTPNKRVVGRNSVVERRESVIKGIEKQVYICEQLLNGEEVVRDKQTGRKMVCWFWLDNGGDYFLSINYGKSAIELSKGKYSIICKDIEEVKSSLLTVKSAIQKGDFDKVLATRSKEIRSNFKWTM